jgi:hypothetical protein
MSMGRQLEEEETNIFEAPSSSTSIYYSIYLVGTYPQGPRQYQHRHQQHQQVSAFLPSSCLARLPHDDKPPTPGADKISPPRLLKTPSS